MTDLEFVNAVREMEISQLIDRYRSFLAGKDLLEIGSGAGAQLRALDQVCKSAVGIESSYRDDRLAKIVDYDGRHIPFPNASFDVLFSSHVLEHFACEKSMHEEMHRILRPDGVCIHVVPSASWRFWASVGHYPALAQKAVRKLHPRREVIHASQASVASNGTGNGGSWQARLSYALIQRRHGEAGNWFSEHFLFRKTAWQSRLESHDWKIVSAEPFGVVLSGNYLLNERMSFDVRRRLSRLLGVSSFVFVVRSVPSTCAS
jgi:predicted SAM-dependent methyltransferase